MSSCLARLVHTEEPGHGRVLRTTGCIGLGPLRDRVTDTTAPSRLSRRRLRVAIIGHARFGIGEPFSGGIESHTALLARSMRDLGHHVTVFAGAATSRVPHDLRVRPIVAQEPDCRGYERIDNPMPAGRWQSEDAGYRSVLGMVADPGAFDVVHNNSLHYLPPVLCAGIRVPMIHTLHSPPFETLHLAHQHRARQHCARPHPADEVVAVSCSLQREWGSLANTVVPNGVTTERWSFGHAASPACVWMGRIVPEKAPHLAIDAARLAGRRIDLAGPVQHPRYFEEEVRPRLGNGARWLGHLCTAALSELCRRAAVGVVTPQWDEPFGLVVAEMLSCGTPVAAFARGAIPELLTPRVGTLATPGDLPSLASAIDAAARLDRRACREHAVEHLSAGVMAARYVELYRRAIAGR